MTARDEYFHVMGKNGVRFPQALAILREATVYQRMAELECCRSLTEREERRQTTAHDRICAALKAVHATVVAKSPRNFRLSQRSSCCANLTAATECISLRASPVLTTTARAAANATPGKNLPCRHCGRKHVFALTSNEANGVFNVFCPGGECEDRYAAKQ